jgi:hypothetical protein
MADAGDVISIAVSGASEEDLTGLLEAIRTVDEFRDRLTPMPAGPARTSDGDFGFPTLVQDFILGTGASLTAAAIAAGVRAAIRGSKGARAAETVHVDVTFQGQGSCEISVRLDEHD